MPDPAEAKLRHVLGWAYAQTGRTAQARREYRRVLETPGLDPAIKVRVEASLAALRPLTTVVTNGSGREGRRAEQHP